MRGRDVQWGGWVLRGRGLWCSCELTARAAPIASTASGAPPEDAAGQAADGAALSRCSRQQQQRSGDECSITHVFEPRSRHRSPAATGTDRLQGGGAACSPVAGERHATRMSVLACVVG